MIFKLQPVSGCITSAARHAVTIAKNNPEHGFILVFNDTHLSVDGKTQNQIVEDYHAQRQ